MSLAAGMGAPAINRLIARRHCTHQNGQAVDRRAQASNDRVHVGACDRANHGRLVVVYPDVVWHLVQAGDDDLDAVLSASQLFDRNAANDRHTKTLQLEPHRLEEGVVAQVRQPPRDRAGIAREDVARSAASAVAADTRQPPNSKKSC